MMRWAAAYLPPVLTRRRKFSSLSWQSCKGKKPHLCSICRFYLGLISCVVERDSHLQKVHSATLGSIFWFLELRGIFLSGLTSFEHESTPKISDRSFLPLSGQQSSHPVVKICSLIFPPPISPPKKKHFNILSCKALAVLSSMLHHAMEWGGGESLTGRI